jgi:hypothetical protein
MLAPYRLEPIADWREPIAHRYEPMRYRLELMSDR